MQQQKSLGANHLSGLGGVLSSNVLSSSSANNNSAASKRLRTTILPEQQEYLMQKYQLDQNPSRKMLDEIAREVCFVFSVCFFSTIFRIL